jgi:Beta-propeller repeat
VSSRTVSTNFPTQNPYQPDQPNQDVFVTKLSPSGNSLVYSTYLGGSSDDQGYGIAVDGSGSAYVTGFTDSTDFPTQNPFQTVQGSIDAFVTKLSLPTPLDFFTLSPCRLIDTRNAVGPYGGPALAAGADRTFTLAGQCGIPATARAVSVNITVTAPSATGNLRLYPAGTTLPGVSSINYAAGQTRGNNAIVSLNTGGAVTVRCAQASGTVDLIVDVNGYFE